MGEVENLPCVLWAMKCSFGQKLSSPHAQGMVGALSACAVPVFLSPGKHNTYLIEHFLMLRLGET